MINFTTKLIRWQRTSGRHDLPWQRTRDPYRIWLAEVMLQQTQVEAVIPYYKRFLARFPDLSSLARASQDDVLRLWSGLGYYARARNLLSAARLLLAEHGGSFPRDAASLVQLPGVGRTTAAAIAAFAFGHRAAILDGNVKRLLARYFGVSGYPGEPAVEQRLWALAESILPARSIEHYTQALMDLGAMVCTRTRPRCEACPVAGACVARSEHRVAELPSPRPRRAQPERKATWLVLRRGDQVLLERRPSTGLWGGLWTFPQIEERNLRDHCRRTLGCDVAAIRRLQPIEHGFTHFRLRAHPILCELRASLPCVQSSRYRWVNLARSPSVAVPAPVRRLLGTLSSIMPLCLTATGEGSAEA